MARMKSMISQEINLLQKLTLKLDTRLNWEWGLLLGLGLITFNGVEALATAKNQGNTQTWGGNSAYTNGENPLYFDFVDLAQTRVEGDVIEHVAAAVVGLLVLRRAACSCALAREPGNARRSGTEFGPAATSARRAGRPRGRHR